MMYTPGLMDQNPVLVITEENCLRAICALLSLLFVFGLHYLC